MKKRLLLPLAALAVMLFAGMGSAKALSWTVSGSSTDTTYYTPFNNYYKYSYSQMIYTASELNTGGSKTFTGIAFQIKRLPTQLRNSIRIYMGTTTSSTFSSSTDWKSVSNQTLVYSGVYNPTATGYYYVTLDKPFVYNGTSNLVITVETNTGRCVSSSAQATKFYCATKSNSVLFTYRDNGRYDADTVSSMSGYRGSDRPAIRLYDATTGSTTAISAGPLNDYFTTQYSSTSYFQETFTGTINRLDSTWTTVNDLGAHWKYTTTSTNSGGVGPRSSGNPFAEFYKNSDVTGELISPRLELSKQVRWKLTFYYSNKSWAGDVDQLNIYWRAHVDEEWRLLEEIEDAHNTWTQASYNLPGTSHIQLMFEVEGNTGYGVTLDDIKIEPITTATGVTSTSLYGFVFNTQNTSSSFRDKFIKMNPTDINAQPTAKSVNTLGKVRAAEYANGYLYYVTGAKTLSRVAISATNDQVASPTSLGTISGIDSVGDMAYNSQNSTMYVVGKSGTSWHIYSLNLSTRATTQLGAFSRTNKYALAINAQGQGYVIDSYINNIDLISITMSNGSYSTVANLSEGNGLSQGHFEGYSMTFDKTTGELFFSAAGPHFETSGECGIYKINLNGSNTTWTYIGKPWYENWNVNALYSLPAPITLSINGPSSITQGQSATFTATTVAGASISWTFPSGTPATGSGTSASTTWSVPGTYTVQCVATKNGESVTATKTVTVNAGTLPLSIEGPTNVTAGESATFTATTSSGAAISWTFPSGTPATGNGTSASTTWSIPGTYTVTCQASLNGMSSTATMEVTVVAGELPLSIDGPEAIYVGENATFTATTTSGASINWVANGGNPATGTGASFTTSWAAPGTYTVNCSASLGAANNETSKTITVMQREGIDEVNGLQAKLYPNPTNGRVNIETGANMTSMELYTIQGSKVRQYNANGTTASIDLSGLASGVYMLRITTDNGSTVKRITLK